MFGFDQNGLFGINPLSNQMGYAGLGLIAANNGQPGALGRGLMAGNQMWTQAQNNALNQQYRKLQMQDTKSQMDMRDKEWAREKEDREYMMKAYESLVERYPQYAGLRPESAMQAHEQSIIESMKPNTTDDIREYQYAVQQGYEGTFRDYMLSNRKAGASNITQTTGGTAPYNVPSNYMLVDPHDYTKGITPIPGGPKDPASESLTPEQAAKTAMLETARTFTPVITNLIFSGGDALTGEINRGVLFEKAMSNVVPGALVPEGSRVGNAMEFGIQAITRGETGAAMPPEEVNNTRKRFEPSFTDSDQVIRQKITAYKLFMNNMSRYLDPTNARKGNWNVDYELAMADAAKLINDTGDGWSIRKK